MKISRLTSKKFCKVTPKTLDFLLEISDLAYEEKISRNVNLRLYLYDGGLKRYAALNT